MIHFIDSEFNKETGISHSMVRYKDRLFFGFSTLHPDDKEFLSEFTGCRYAHLKAEIKALKYELRLKKQECEACRKFVKSIEQYKMFNNSDPSAKAMYRQLNRRIREVNALVDEINEKEMSLAAAIRRQDKINKRFTALDSAKENTEK